MDKTERRLLVNRVNDTLKLGRERLKEMYQEALDNHNEADANFLHRLLWRGPWGVAANYYLGCEQCGKPFYKCNCEFESEEELQEYLYKTSTASQAEYLNSHPKDPRHLNYPPTPGGFSWQDKK